MKIESLDHFVEIVGERIELVAAAGFEQVGMVEDSRYRQKHHNGKKPEDTGEPAPRPNPLPCVCKRTDFSSDPGKLTDYLNLFSAYFAHCERGGQSRCFQIGCGERASAMSQRDNPAYNASISWRKIRSTRCSTSCIVSAIFGKLRRLDFAHSAQRPPTLSLKNHQYTHDNRRYPDKLSRLHAPILKNPCPLDRPATLAS
jgi:hypothetical protein